MRHDDTPRTDPTAGDRGWQDPDRTDQTDRSDEVPGTDRTPTDPAFDEPAGRDLRADESDVPFERPSDEPVGGAYGAPADAGPGDDLGRDGDPAFGHEAEDELGPHPDDPTLGPDDEQGPGRDAEPLAGGQSGAAAPVPSGTDEDTGAVLFGDDQVDRFRNRWRELQADFVDDPKQAVRGADELVDEVMRTLSEIFAEHKSDLQGQWQGDGDGHGETEELRVALRRYRSFFDQLLNT